MVYLQDPFPLPYNHSLKLRMGRTTLSLQVCSVMCAAVFWCSVFVGMLACWCVCLFACEMLPLD